MSSQCTVDRFSKQGAMRSQTLKNDLLVYKSLISVNQKINFKTNERMATFKL